MNLGEEREMDLREIEWEVRLQDNRRAAGGALAGILLFVVLPAVALSGLLVGMALGWWGR